jgi:hypothetical protein
MKMGSMYLSETELDEGGWLGYETMTRLKKSLNFRIFEASLISLIINKLCFHLTSYIPYNEKAYSQLTTHLTEKAKTLFYHFSLVEKFFQRLIVVG